MKTFKAKKNKKTFIISLLLVAAIAGAVITIALAVAKSNDVTNTFEAADHSTEIIEKVDADLTKEVQVKNTAEKSPAFIRVRLTVSPEKLNGSLVFDEEAIKPGKWADGGDGFYYYQTAVAAGDITGKLLARVDEAALQDFDGDTFDITVYEESCVATVSANTQVTVADMQKAFKSAAGD